MSQTVTCNFVPQVFSSSSCTGKNPERSRMEHKKKKKMDKEGLIYRGAAIFNPVPQRNHCLGSQILSAVSNEGRR